MMARTIRVMLRNQNNKSQKYQNNPEKDQNNGFVETVLGYL